MTSRWISEADQDAITEQTMRLTAGRTLTVRERREGDYAPTDAILQLTPWVVVDANTDIVQLFGPAPYGGLTLDDALDDARRLAGKWDWHVAMPCGLCDGNRKADWPEYAGADHDDIPDCPRCNGTGLAP